MLMKTARWMVPALIAVTLIGCGGGDAPKTTKKAAPAAGGGAGAAAPQANGAGPAGGKVDLSKPATIKGIAKFQGTAPAPQKLNLSKDAWCDKNHTVMSENLLVDAQGGLKNAVAFVKELDKYGKDFGAPAGDAMFTQKGCQYVPHVLAVRANQTVNVVNADQTTHNYHFTGRRNEEINKTQSKPSTDQVMFAKAEINASFQCDVHPWMSARVHVFEHPCFNVSIENGAFEITGVPPGTYHIAFEHESAKAAEIEVTVGAGETKDIGAVTFTAK